MKKINKPALLISFLTLTVACSALSISSVAENLRYSWEGINPWNGVEGIAFTISYFLRTGLTVTMLITIGVLALLWWRLYTLFNRWLRKE